MTAYWSSIAPAWLAVIWRLLLDRLPSSRIRKIERTILTKQVVAALVLREDEILCCQRTEHQALPLKWEFPGGKIEAGETPPQALRRELEEELGILAEIGPEVTRIVHTYANGNSVNLRFFVVHSFANDLQNRIFRDVRWVRRSDLPVLDFLDADKELVRQLAAGELL
jgi:8-oxo-dGTP diphosphatase